MGNGFFQSGAAAPYYIDAQAYGAVGDNAHDDTSALQAALDANAGPVFLRPGIYKITSTLNISNNCGGFIGTANNGSSSQCSIIRWHGNTNSTMVKCTPTTTQTGVIMSALQLDGNSTDGVTAFNGGDMGEGGRIELVRCVIEGNNTRGLYFNTNLTHPGTGPYYIEIIQCDIHGNNAPFGTSGSIGIFFDTLFSVPNGSYQGPNANRIHGGRLTGLDYAVWVKGGGDNVFDSVDCEAGINVAGFRIGQSVADKSYSITSATRDTVTVSGAGWDNNQWVNGTARVTTGAVTYYFEVAGNTSNTITFFIPQQVVPSASDNLDLLYRTSFDNQFNNCRQEGESGANMFQIEDSDLGTTISGGSSSSLGLGKEVSGNLFKVSNRIIPEAWSEPFPLTFIYNQVAANLSGVELPPNGLGLPMILDRQWQVLTLYAQLDSDITGGTLKLWVADNGAAINGSTPDLFMTSTNFDTTGTSRFCAVRFPQTGRRCGGGGGPKFLSLLLTTTSGWLPITANLQVTAMVQTIG